MFTMVTQTRPIIPIPVYEIPNIRFGDPPVGTAGEVVKGDLLTMNLDVVANGIPEKYTMVWEVVKGSKEVMQAEVVLVSIASYGRLAASAVEFVKGMV